MKKICVLRRICRLAGLKPSAYILALLVALAPLASAQTIPHVSGTFKTPEGKTPSAAGLKAIATIGATLVYGSIDFQPYDSQGNRPTRILCGGNTYVPQRVRGWIKGDGTLVDNYTAAAGVDLVPNTGCTPSGLVTRAFITLSGTADGRVQSMTWTEDKTLPSQASIDWGALAASGVTAPTYIGYSTISVGGAAVTARSILNFTSGTCVDNPITLATDCAGGGGGGGATLQTNSVNNTSQATLNLKSSAATNGLTLTETNTGAGDVQLGLSGTLTPAGGGTGSGSNTGAAGKVLIGNGSGQFIEGDPLVQGVIAHDAAAAAISPVLAGCYANAAAPADVSADVDAVREWCLRNGSQVVNLASGGTLITNGQKAMASSLPVVIASDQSAVAVSGTVTANIGTTNGLALDATLTGGSAKVQGNAASAASDSGNPLKVGGVFNTTQPTVTTGQRVDFQSTSRGAQIVATGADAFNVTTQANASVNLTQLNSVALGSPSNYGTSPGAVSVQGVNAFITNTPAVSQSGNWTARIVGNAGGVLDAAGQNAGSPANELLMAGQFNTAPTTITSGNVSPLQLDSSGNLKVNIIAGGGTGGGPADVGLSTAASESDAARQKVTSAVRLWDQAQSAGSQMVGWRGDTSSGAWVNCKAGCSGAADTVGGAGTLNALNTTATVGLAGDGGAGMFLAAGTLVGTIVPEVSYDGGTTWVASLFYDPAAQTTAASVVFGSSNTATTRSVLVAGGASNARVRVSVFTSGTASATMRATANAGSLVVNQGNAPWSVSGTVTANIGTSGSLALDASVTGLEIAQASSTSGQKGILGLGAVTTSAPTYTTAQSSPLSLTTAGALRVDGSGVTQPISGTVTANAGSGTFNIQANASVNVAQINGVTPLMGNGLTGTGSPRVTIASDNTAFSVNAAQSGTWTVQPGNTANSTPWLVTDSADMTGTTPGTAPSKTAIVGAIFNSAAPTATNGQTLPLQSDASGRLIVNCGTGCSAAAGLNYATVTLFSAQAATGTATSSAIQLPTFSTLGTLNVTGAGITGSPSGCSVALASQATTGTPTSAAYQTISFTPASSFQSFAAGSSAVPTADKIVATYACTGYPSAGTISVTFSPMTAEALTNIGGAPFAQGQRTMANSLSFVPASDYSSPDTVGSSIALNALNAAASAAMNAQEGVGVIIASGTLTGTLTPEVSYDGGTSWSATQFQDPATLQLSSTLALSNPNATTQKTIVTAGGVSNARVRVSSFTSGSATATVRATLTNLDPVTAALGIAGTPSTAVMTVQGVAGGTNVPVNCVSGCTGGGGATDKAAFTEGTTTFSAIGGEYVNSTVGLTNGQAGVARLTGDRTLMVFDPTVSNLLNLMYSQRGTITTGASALLGSLNRRVTSTGDALDVNVKYAPAAPVPTISAQNALTPFRNGAVTTTVLVKGAPGNLYSWYLQNPNGSVCSLDFFNTAAPTLGTTVPVYSLVVPANAAANVSPGVYAWANFNAVISVAAVTAPGGAATCATGMAVNLGVM